MPAALPPAVSLALLKAGVRRVVVGHLPHGNCPTLIPGVPPGVAGFAELREASGPQPPPDAAVDVLLTDTSYSDAKAPDMRGRAVSEAQVRGASRPSPSP